MRPKSMATVVVVLPGTWLVSSTPTLAEVMTASVVSGMISDTAPTKVVLPTPKPPAMTILTGVGAGVELPPGMRLDGPESIQHPLEKCEVGPVAWAGGAVHDHEPLVGHVTDEDPRHAERDVEPGRDLRNADDVPAEQRDRAPLQAEGRYRLLAERRGRHQGLQLQLEVHMRGTGTPAGHRVGPHEPAWTMSVLGTHGRSFCSSRERGLELGAQGRGEHVPRACHEQGHLIADQTDVAVERCQHRKARPVADRHHEQEALLHLDDGLVHGTAPETAGGALRQAGQARGDRGELVRPGTVQLLGHRHEQPVPGRTSSPRS